METYELYCIINTVNNKKYVGQTKTSRGYKHRFNEHLREARYNKSTTNKLKLAIRKYGTDKFIVKRLLKNIPKESINFYECLWIQKLNTYKHGYNATQGGSGVVGYVYTELLRKKQSERSKRNWTKLKQNVEKFNCLCQKHSAKMLGVPKSFLHKKHLSESRMKLNLKGIKDGFYGKHHNLRTKQRISDAVSVGVVGINVVTKARHEFKSIKSASDFVIRLGLTSNKFASTRICGCCKRKTNYKSAYGFYWMYKDKCND